MQKSSELLDLRAVSTYFGLSESSIRRHVRAARDGQGNFPLPLFKSGCRVLWRRSDIEAWSGESAETIVFNPSLAPSIPQTVPMQNSAQVRKRLKALGIDLPPTSNEPDS